MTELIKRTSLACIIASVRDAISAVNKLKRRGAIRRGECSFEAKIFGERFV